MIRVAALKQRNFLGSAAVLDPEHRLFRSETGELTIDGPEDRLILDTARTAGGYSPAGKSVEAANAGVKIALEGSDATVWVSAIDKKPIRQKEGVHLGFAFNVPDGDGFSSLPMVAG